MKPVNLTQKNIWTIQPRMLAAQTIFSLFMYLLAAFIMTSEARSGRSQTVYAYRNFSSMAAPERMILVGEIKSKTREATVRDEDSPFVNYDTRLDQVIVQVQDPYCIVEGQTLYVVDKRPDHRRDRDALIIGEVVVRSIFRSPYYGGWALSATGNLLRVREGQFVVRTLESENLDRAYVMRKRADHLRAAGRVDEAISAYREALEVDRNLPEAHAALGSIYMEETITEGTFSMVDHSLPVRGLTEFEQAWRKRGNFRYEVEKLHFFQDYMNALNLTYDIRRNEAGRGDQLIRHLNRILEAGAEATDIMENHPDIELHLLRANYALLELYRSPASAAERDLYEQYEQRTAELIESLNEHFLDFQRYARVMQDFLEGRSANVRMTVHRSEFHRIAVLYFSHMHRTVSASPEYDEHRRRFRTLVTMHADAYERYRPDHISIDHRVRHARESIEE